VDDIDCRIISCLKENARTKLSAIADTVSLSITATADRILRDTKIGTASAHLDPSDPYIHEGPEAYVPQKRRKEQ